MIGVNEMSAASFSQMNSLDHRSRGCSAHQTVSLEVWGGGGGGGVGEPQRPSDLKPAAALGPAALFSCHIQCSLRVYSEQTITGTSLGQQRV